jgi:hypothetical protein
VICGSFGAWRSYQDTFQHSMSSLTAFCAVIYTCPRWLDGKIQIKAHNRHRSQKRIIPWMHKDVGRRGLESKEAIEFHNKNGIDVMYDLCPMMFFPPVGMLKLHFWFKKIFGKLPEEFSEKG